LVTRVRRNMKNRLLPLFDKLLLRKRSIIEPVSDQLKNISQIEHSCHRSPFNFFVNLIAGLAAYTFREKKPSLNIRSSQALPVVLM
ncbi:transposase, partial [Nitrosomonas sp. Nm166]|uniref:transposase n=1 Tax=Nitrosomonas sp. Nm166 TaxID=1881054 RepID=UPI0008EA1C3B